MFKGRFSSSSRADLRRVITSNNKNNSEILASGKGFCLFNREGKSRKGSRGDEKKKHDQFYITKSETMAGSSVRRVSLSIIPLVCSGATFLIPMVMLRILRTQQRLKWHLTRHHSRRFPQASSICLQRGYLPGVSKAMRRC